MLLPYLKFLFKSKDEHSLHSPFVFELYTEIIKINKSEPVFKVIEKFRNEQLANKKLHRKLLILVLGQNIINRTDVLYQK